MQDNLEEISFAEVADNNGACYTDFRKNLHPRYSKVAFDIATGYLFLGLFSVTTIFLARQFLFLWWVFVPFMSIAIGYVAAYLALFIHEAGHYNIHPNKKMNDRLATLFICLPFGLSIKSYRKLHWQHHVHLSTPQDTQISYFNALTKIFVLETLTGIHLLRTLRQEKSKSVLTKEQVKENQRMLIAGAGFHGIILTVSFLTGDWPFAIAWLAGFGVFFPFFATIRQILEHRDELAHHTPDFYKQPNRKISRLFVHTLASSSFGAAGFTRHMIHHWDPQISYTRLKDIEEFLINCEKTAPIIHSSRTTYARAFKKLIAAS